MQGSDDVAFSVQRGQAHTFQEAVVTLCTHKVSSKKSYMNFVQF